MSVAQPLWGETFAMPPNMTADDLVRLPEDGYRYELYEGVLVREMTFAGHGDLCQRLGFELGLYARTTGFPNRILQNALFDFSPPGASKRTILAPDISILRTSAVQPWNAMPGQPPLLAIEVVSESQSLAELTLKAQVYRQAGDDEVWVVDHKSRTVEVWNDRGQATLTDAETITSTLLPCFQLGVRALLEG